MNLLPEALAYLQAGITVIPIALDGSKAPATKKWRDYHQRPPTEAEIRKMFAKPSGLAILGGKTSGNLTIIDFDRPGAFDAWKELLASLAPGLLERLPVVSTPGGHHVYLRAAICLGNTKLAKPAQKFTVHGVEKDTIIETRGQGGYVIAPPSPADVHPTKIRYQHFQGPPLAQIPTLTDDEYNTLINAARAFNEQAKAAKEERQQPKQSAPNEGAKPGEDFDERGTWREVLEPHGWEEIRTIGDKTYWRRPGKKDGGISATTGHCGTKLYVFSSNAAPFESERAYNKFSAYGLLNCNGDYSEASRQLRAKGYGATRERNYPVNRPSESKWNELNQGLERIANGEPPQVEAPLPSDEDAPADVLPPAQIVQPITAAQLEEALADDPAAALRPALFVRLLATREDRAEWALIQDVLRRHKQRANFTEALKQHDADSKRKAHASGWRKELLFRENKNGDLVEETCLKNLVLVLSNESEWRGVLAFDEFLNQIVTRRTPPFPRRSNRWSDEDALEVKMWVESNYPMRPTFNLICEAILVVSKRASFSSQREYLDNLSPVDGEGSIDTWLIDCFGAPDTRYVREVGRRWLIAAVARAYVPGCKVDNVLILEGQQGLKKSRALQQLCPSSAWFADGLSEFGSKAQAEEIEGKWIVELGELKGIGRDLDQTKAFVTRQAENYRPAYGRYTIHSPRKCVFAGTVNPGNVGYLKDETGNRRWWPVLCTKQSPEITPELRDRLWSEAKALYEAGEHWWLEDPELIAEAVQEQEQRAAQDPWHETVERFSVGQRELGTDDVLGEALKIDKARWDNAATQRVGRIFMQMKWTRRRRRDAATGKPRWRYLNPIYANEPEPPEPSPNGFDPGHLFPS